MNKFAEALDSGRSLVTAQCLPPAGCDPDSIRSLAASLPPELDAIVVADNPDRIRASAFSAAVLLGREANRTVLVSMTTRDRNRLALLSDALGAAALGIAGILCVSGHHQSLGVCPQAAAANDLDSVQLAQSLKKVVLYGSAMNGRGIEPGLELQVGAAAHPALRPLGLNLLRLKKKVSVGADFLITRPVFDPDGFSEWLDAVRAADLDKRTAIFAGVMPLTSAAQAEEWRRAHPESPAGDAVAARMRGAADAEREGVAIAAEAAARLKELPGVRGIHILCGGCEHLAEAVMDEAGLFRVEPVDAQVSRIASILSL